MHHHAYTHESDASTSSLYETYETKEHDHPYRTLLSRVAINQMPDNVKLGTKPSNGHGITSIACNQPDLPQNNKPIPARIPSHKISAPGTANTKSIISNNKENSNFIASQKRTRTPKIRNTKYTIPHHTNQETTICNKLVIDKEIPTAARKDHTLSRNSTITHP